MRKFGRPHSLSSESAERKSAFGLARAQGYPVARLNRCFSHSPVDALIDLVVRCQLPHQILVWLDSGTLAHLRITVLPQRWCACLGDLRGLRNLCCHANTLAWRGVRVDCFSYVNVVHKIAQTNIN
jgi:hypothetical protein